MKFFGRQISGTCGIGLIPGSNNSLILGTLMHFFINYGDY